MSLTVQEGEIFGFLGPNGAGKTTLISILSGILSPDTGHAEILGIDCTKDAKKAQRIINVASGFTGVLPTLSAEEALRYYCLLYNVTDPAAKITSVLALTGLSEVRKVEVENLSAGLRQRYQIAKALLNDPRILILDEPSVGLDVESAISIRAMIKQLRKQGRTILLTTHNMFEAEELCDRVAFINHGKILDVGTVAQLKEKMMPGRAIEINCSDAPAVVARLSRLEGVGVRIMSERLVLVSADSSGRIKNLLDALAGMKIEIYNLSVLEPTLEEAYLKIIKKGGKDAR